MFAAAESIRKLQDQITHSLREGSVQFALSGSNATFAWIADVDESAPRQYRNIEFIIDRADSENVIRILTHLDLIAGMLPDQISFQERINQHKRWTHRALFAGEQIAVNHTLVPSLREVVSLRDVPVVSLEPLVTFQLSRWLLDDRVDLLDMIEVGLVDSTWLARLPDELAGRLKELLDTPDG